MKVSMALSSVLIVGFLVANVKAISDEQKMKIANKLMPIGLECATKNPLTVADIRAFQKKMMPEGNNPKCFSACMFKKVGVMDDKGMISSTGSHQYANEMFEGNEEHLKNAGEVMKTCILVNDETTTDGDKGCDRAKLLYNCVIENAPKHGFNFDF